MILSIGEILADANIENKEWTRENIESALLKANKAGADTTQFLGAVKL